MAAKKKPVKKPAKKKPSTKRRAPQRRPRAQPESFRARSVSPSLTVADLARSEAWYRDVLGFMVKDRWAEGAHGGGVELVAGTASLSLIQDDFAKGRDRKKGEGMRLWLRTVQDIDVIAARIRARGGVLDQEPRDMPWGDRLFSLSDPDGYKFNIAGGR
jgi:lactoylglutathione lyase